MPCTRIIPSVDLLCATSSIQSALFLTGSFSSSLRQGMGRTRSSTQHTICFSLSLYLRNRASNFDDFFYNCFPVFSILPMKKQMMYCVVLLVLPIPCLNDDKRTSEEEGRLDGVCCTEKIYS